MPAHGAFRPRELEQRQWAVLVPAGLEIDDVLEIVAIIGAAGEGVACLTCDDTGVGCCCPRAKQRERR
jgi:hypothetical protein